MAKQPKDALSGKPTLGTHRREPSESADDQNENKPAGEKKEGKEQSSESPTEMRDKAQPRKPARRILEQEMSEGLTEIERSTGGLVIAGLSAGLDLGFSVFLMATLMSLNLDGLPRIFMEMMVALAYSIGFIFVVIGRSELFTEHTTLAILPVLDQRASLGELLRLWGIIYSSNLFGGILFAILAVIIGPALGVIQPSAFGEIARLLVQPVWWVILLSGLLAGWLMGLLSWLVAAARDTTSQILIIILVTATIGFLHLHHSIAGTIEVMVGVFSGEVSLAAYLHFLLWATLGNIVGGTFFVGVIKYTHVIRSDVQPAEVNIDEEKGNNEQPSTRN